MDYSFLNINCTRDYSSSNLRLIATLSQFMLLLQPMNTKQLELLFKILKSNNYSSTSVRKEVFKVFQENDAISMGELIDKLDAKVDRSSAYRTVDLFIKLGIVKRIQIGWNYKLELSDDFLDHHHHIACSNCGKIDSLGDSQELEKQIANIAKKAKYQLTGHIVELVGLCEECQKV